MVGHITKTAVKGEKLGKSVTKSVLTAGIIRAEIMMRDIVTKAMMRARSAKANILDQQIPNIRPNTKYRAVQRSRKCRKWCRKRRRYLVRVIRITEAP